MAFPRPPKRFAILVGVNLYQSNGSRSQTTGEIVSLRQLNGCVNDVQAVNRFIQQKFEIASPCILTAEASSNQMVPKEPRQLLPTFENIAKHFDEVHREAQAGDLFLFYFSGHGARLPTVRASPKDGRTTDPSLMTVDYCCGKPALRGWQLNQWLKRLHANKVQAITILDSCYSGGAWRSDDSIRTPEDWSPPPNLAADEDAAAVMDEEARRDSRLEQIWGVDPKGSTVMTACQIHEYARERAIATPSGYVKCGAFTHQLLDQLNQSRSKMPTYRILRDQIANKIESQTPQTFGRDRLTFFGDKEPFSAVSNIVQIQKGHAILPLGRIHGIYPGSEFTTCLPARPYTITVDWVDAARCGQQVDPLIAHYFERHNEVSLCRPHIGADPFRIDLDPVLWHALHPLLARNIEFRIAGDIEWVQSGAPAIARPHLPGTMHVSNNELRLTANDRSHVDICGPASLVGYSGAVRGLTRAGGSIEQVAEGTATSVAHLIRFAQILNLRHHASQFSNEFCVSVAPRPYHPLDNAVGNTWNGSSYMDQQLLRYIFKNNCTKDLHVTVLILSPGFHVRQVWPVTGNACRFKNGIQDGFNFNVTIPRELQKYSFADRSALHRDIIRTVVTTQAGPSFRGMELPNIWDASVEESGFRDGTVASDIADITWWIHDEEIMTRFS